MNNYLNINIKRTASRLGKHFSLSSRHRSVLENPWLFEHKWFGEGVLDRLPVKPAQGFFPFPPSNFSHPHPQQVEKTSEYLILLLHCPAIPFIPFLTDFFAYSDYWFRDLRPRSWKHGTWHPRFTT
jgi:hypothetical protein